MKPLNARCNRFVIASGLKLKSKTAMIYPLYDVRCTAKTKLKFNFLCLLSPTIALFYVIFKIAEL